MSDPEDRAVATAPLPPARRPGFSLLGDHGRQLGVAERDVAAIGILGFLGATAEAFALVLFAYLATALTDAATTIGIAGQRISVYTAILVGLVLLLARLLTAALVARNSAQIGMRVLTRTRTRLLSSFLSASWAARQKRPIGDLQERFSNHVDRAAEYFVWQGILVNGGLSLFAFLGTALVVSPLVALAAGAIGGLVVSGIRPMSRRARTSATSYAQQSQRLSTRLTDYVLLSRDIEVFGVKDPVLRATRDPIEENGRHFLTSRFFMQFSPQVYQTVLMAVGIGAVAVAFASDIDPGSLASIGAVLLMLLRSMSAMQQVLSARQAINQRESYVRMTADYLAELEGDRSPVGTRTASSVVPLEVDGVGFRYDSRSEPVFEDLNLRIEPGEALGVAGASGAGKTTLVSLLLRLRQPTWGTIAVQGTPISEIRNDIWARQVSFVPQDPVILPGTIADNVRFFRDISDDAVSEALAAAHLEREVGAMSDGLSTRIGEEGVALSGGQRQRLAIARALVGGPALLILDEPTSALDDASELAVRQTLEGLGGKVAVIVIAHRGTTLSICDRVLMLEGGTAKVVERGSGWGSDVLVPGGENYR